MKYSDTLLKKAVKFLSLVVFRNRLEKDLPENGVSVSAVDSAL